MPTTLQHLTTNRKPVTLEVYGDTVTLEYYPMRVTGEMLIEYASINKIQEMPEERALKVITQPDELLLTLLASWDLMEPLDEDGTPSATPLAINEANISALGLMLQWAFVHAIMADAGNQGKATAPAGSANKRPSGAGSSRKAR